MKAPSKWKVKVSVEIKPVVDSWMFKLHYRWSYLLFVLSAALATLYDAIGELRREEECVYEAAESEKLLQAT